MRVDASSSVMRFRDTIVGKLMLSECDPNMRSKKSSCGCVLRAHVVRSNANRPLAKMQMHLAHECERVLGERCGGLTVLDANNAHVRNASFSTSPTTIRLCDVLCVLLLNAGHCLCMRRTRRRPGWRNVFVRMDRRSWNRVHRQTINA